MNIYIHIDVELVVVDDFGIKKSVIRTARPTPANNIPIMHPLIYVNQRADFFLIIPFDNVNKQIDVNTLFQSITSKIST